MLIDWWGTTSTDSCGNTATATQSIELKDTEAPMVTISAVTVPCCTDVSGLTNTGTPTLSDNCSPTSALTMTYSDSVSNPACGSSFTRTFRVAGTSFPVGDS